MNTLLPYIQKIRNQTKGYQHQHKKIYTIPQRFSNQETSLLLDIRIQCLHEFIAFFYTSIRQFCRLHLDTQEHALFCNMWIICLFFLNPSLNIFSYFFLQIYSWVISWSPTFLQISCTSLVTPDQPIASCTSRISLHILYVLDSITYNDQFSDSSSQQNIPKVCLSIINTRESLRTPTMNQAHPGHRLEPGCG